MNTIRRCPKCEERKIYEIRRNRLRCSDCHYEFSRKKYLGGLRLSDKKWKEIIFWFLIGQSIRRIQEHTGVSKNSITKAVRILRAIMIKDIPRVFSGTVEVDETYLGGKKRNKRKDQIRKDIETFGKESNSGFGTTKQPVFGILTRKGKVYAKIVDDTEARDLIPIITKKVKTGSNICSDTWRAYTGLAARGYVHRTVNHGDKEYAKGTNHINGLEGFWGYLKRQLSAKGGVQRQYLHLFLGEYVWKYNHRGLEVNDQVTRLFKKLTKFSGKKRD